MLACWVTSVLTAGTAGEHAGEARRNLSSVLMHGKPLIISRGSSPSISEGLVMDGGSRKKDISGVVTVSVQVRDQQ